MEKRPQKCEHCAKEFTPKRKTAKFCSDRCRVQYHRWRDKSVSTPFAQAAELINHIGKMTEGTLSFEAIQALKSLKSICDFQDISRHDSHWHCRNCWKIVTKVMPQDNDCSCGKTQDARWILQKRFV